MKASDIDPTSWRFGDNKPKTNMLMRKWDGIRRNARRMESMLIELMSNPATTPEQLAQASKLYASVTEQMHAHAKMTMRNCKVRNNFSRLAMKIDSCLSNYRHKRQLNIDCHK